MFRRERYAGGAGSARRWCITAAALAGLVMLAAGCDDDFGGYNGGGGDAIYDIALTIADLVVLIINLFDD